MVSHVKQSGNGKTPMQRIALQTVGLGAAEFISGGVALGVVGFADQIAPGPIKDISKTISKICIEPYLDSIENVMGKFCKLEECKRDTTKSREERAEELAHVLVVFSASFALSMLAKINARSMMNKALGVPHHDNSSRRWWEFWKISKPELMIFAADEGVHYGSLLLMNTSVANYTDDLIRATTNVLTKCGVPEKKAHELAAYTMIWEVPNALGFAAGTAAIAGIEKYGWGKGGKDAVLHQLLHQGNSGPSHSLA